jgi:transcriptional regulator with XRE-family HTH domain
MNRRAVQSRLTIIREERMWTQGRLAEEARVSPTTVSGIESGRISRPHFGTIKKLAEALGVDPRELLSLGGSGNRTPPAPFSLGWARSSRETEFEEGLENATLGSLQTLLRKLGEEQERLRQLYGEARDAEQRRLVKRRIRDVAGQHGSVEASIAHHPDLEASPGEQGSGE